MPLTHISSKQVLQQLYADLTGKDSYRGITLSYAWLANQFGHFALGFIPTLMAWAVLMRCTSWARPAWGAAVIISLFWLVFETFNFLGPLLLKKQSRSRFFFVPAKDTYTFPPAWGNIAFDTLTDLLFFGLGAFSAALFLAYTHTLLLILSVLFLATFSCPAPYWFRTKLYWQYANYPFQFRLSQWHTQAGLFTDADKETIEAYLQCADKECGHHLLVLGGRRSGKSSLCVGIGTELSIRRHAVSYYTALKLLNLFSLSEAAIRASEQAKVWTWRTASLLIIDDINPGHPAPPLISAATMLQAIDKDPALHNRACLQNKNVIWVLGSNDTVPKWIQMLTAIGVAPGQIKTVGGSGWYTVEESAASENLYG